MKLLESGGNGAKLYATFQNGLAYEVALKQKQHAPNIKHVYECVNPIRTKAGHIGPPLSHICV